MGKNNLTFINILKISLKEKLPAEISHKKFLPKTRKIEIINNNLNNNLKKSAVMIILFRKIDKIFSILIKRNEYNGVHSAQIGLPGGKFENIDINLENTAIRETFEEIGVLINSNQIIGSLTPIIIPVSNFIVYPFISYIDNVENFKLDSKEVSEIIFYDIDDLFNDNNILMTNVSAVDNVIEAPAFNLNKNIVWGATAMILSELKDIMKHNF